MLNIGYSLSRPRVAQNPIMQGINLLRQLGDQASAYFSGVNNGPANVARYSTDLTNAVYFKTNVNTTANSISRANSSNIGFLQGVPTNTLGEYSTLVLKAKALTTGNGLGMRISGTWPNRADTVVNTSTGQVMGTFVNGFSAPEVTVAGPDANGYYTFALTARSGGSVLGSIVFGPTDYSTASISAWEAGSSILSDVSIVGVGAYLGKYSAQDIINLGGISNTLSTAYDFVPSSSIITGFGLQPPEPIDYLGPQLLSNGDFSAGLSDWSLIQPTAGIVALEDGGMRLRSTDGSFASFQSMSLLLTVGKKYRISFNVRGYVAGQMCITIDGTTNAYVVPAGNGSFSFDTVSAAPGVCQFKRLGGSTCDLIVDDIVIREIITGSGLETLGNNLITNGTFATDITGWVTEGGATAASVGGELVVTNTAGGTSEQVAQNIYAKVYPGIKYRLIIRAKKGTATGFQYGINGNTYSYFFSSTQANVGWAQFSVDFIPDKTQTACVVRLRTIGIGTAIFDNVSVQQVVTVPFSSWSNNYSDSNASTVAKVDGPVGFIPDSGTYTDRNLTPSGVSLNGNVDNGDGTYTVSFASGTSIRFLFNLTELIQGGYYEPVITIVSSNGGTISTDWCDRSSIVRAVFTGDVITFNDVRSAYDSTYRFLDIGCNTAGSFTFSVKLRRLSGDSAIQATTANKPTLRRGYVNQHWYSGDVANSTTWQRGGGVASVTAGQPDPYGSLGAFLVTSTAGSACYFNVPGAGQAALGNSVTYTKIVVVKPVTTGKVIFEFADNGAMTSTTFDVNTMSVSGTATSGATITALPGGWFSCARVFTTGATGTQNASVIYIDNYGASSGNSMIIYRAGMFKGTVNSSTLEALGGIPLTTTTPVSTALGNYFIEGDGTAKQLTTVTAPFQLADDFVMIAGSTCTYGTPLNSVLSLTSQTLTNPVVEIGYTNGGIPRAVWRDDSGTLVQQVHGSSTTGIPTVISATKRGNTKLFKVNGSLIGTDSSVMGTTTADSLGVGYRPGATGANYLNGGINCFIVIRGQISDSDLLTLERFVGALTGPTGVSF